MEVSGDVVSSIEGPWVVWEVWYVAVETNPETAALG